MQHRQTPPEIRAGLAAGIRRGVSRRATRNCWERFVPPEPLPNARPAAGETVAQTIRGEDRDCREGALAGVLRKVPRTGSRRAPGCSRSFRPRCRRSGSSTPGSITGRTGRWIAASATRRPTRMPRIRRGESKDVLIPQRDVCLECHSPPSQSGAGDLTGRRPVRLRRVPPLPQRLGAVGGRRGQGGRPGRKAEPGRIRSREATTAEQLRIRP